MIPQKRIPTHPGVILVEEFLKPMGLTQRALKDHLGIPMQRLNEICRSKRSVSPGTAWLLAQAFRTSPEFWLNLQAQHDLALNRPTRQVKALARRTT